MQRTGKASLTRSSCYRRTLAQVIESWTAYPEGAGQVADPAERETLGSVAKLVTPEDRTMRLDQAARSIFLTESLSRGRHHRRQAGQNSSSSPGDGVVSKVPSWGLAIGVE